MRTMTLSRFDKECYSYRTSALLIRHVSTLRTRQRLGTHGPTGNITSCTLDTFYLSIVPCSNVVSIVLSETRRRSEILTLLHDLVRRQLSAMLAKPIAHRLLRHANAAPMEPFVGTVFVVAGDHIAIAEHERLVINLASRKRGKERYSRLRAGLGSGRRGAVRWKRAKCKYKANDRSDASRREESGE